jgi:hypothetical protein
MDQILMKELVSLLKASTFIGSMYALFAVLICILILYIISAILGKPINIGIGPIKLNLGSDKSIITKKDKIFVINQTKAIIINNEKKKIELKYDTLRRQLNYAEEKVGDIKSLLAEIYSNKLKEKLPDAEKHKVKTHVEYKNYQMILKLGLYDCVIRILKRAFKTNHLEEMDFEEWEKYINHKTDLGIQQLSEFFDIMYGNNSLITREELHDINNKNMPQFKQEIKDILNSAKAIQAKNHKKITDLNNAMDKGIEQIIENNNK